MPSKKEVDDAINVLKKSISFYRAPFADGEAFQKWAGKHSNEIKPISEGLLNLLKTPDEIRYWGDALQRLQNGNEEMMRDFLSSAMYTHPKAKKDHDQIASLIVKEKDNKAITAWNTENNINTQSNSNKKDETKIHSQENSSNIGEMRFEDAYKKGHLNDLYQGKGSPPEKKKSKKSLWQKAKKLIKDHPASAALIGLVIVGGILSGGIAGLAIAGAAVSIGATAVVVGSIILNTALLNYTVSKENKTNARKQKVIDVEVDKNIKNENTSKTVLSSTTSQKVSSTLGTKKKTTHQSDPSLKDTSKNNGEISPPNCKTGFSSYSLKEMQDFQIDNNDNDYKINQTNITMKVSSLESFKTALKCFKHAHNDKLPSIKTDSPSSKEKWVQALKEVYPTVNIDWGKRITLPQTNLNSKEDANLEATTHQPKF